MLKSPENYFMCLGKYAYDPFKKDGNVYIRIAHRGSPNYVSVVKVIGTKMGYTYDFVSSTMPGACVNEFIGVLQRNMALLMKCGLDAD